jgi:hypothetical protein
VVAYYKERESIERCHVQSSLSLLFYDGNLEKERVEEEQEQERMTSKKRETAYSSFVHLTTAQIK